MSLKRQFCRMRNILQLQHKRIARQWLDLISAGDVQGVCEITSTDWRMHGSLRRLPPGHEGVRLLFEDFGRTRQHWLVEDVIAEGNRVVVRAMNCWQVDSLLGIARRSEVKMHTVIFIHRISRGLITETWRYADDFSRMKKPVVKLSLEEKEDSTKKLVADIFSETMQTLRRISVY